MALSKSVPNGWRQARLGDLVSINSSQRDLTEASNIQYLDIKAVVAPGKLSEPTEICAAAAPSRARRRVSVGDILVSTVRPNLRGFARVQEASPNLIASTGFAVLTPKPEVVGSLLYQHVMTHAFAQYLDKRTTGQAYPAVRPDDVASYKLLLPPLEEQRRIAGILDSIDEAIERTEEVIAATERLRDALLHDLLTRGLPGRHTEWKKVRGLGTIPACWNVVRLGDVAGVNLHLWNPSEEDEEIQYLDLTAVSGPGLLDEPRQMVASGAPSRARRKARAGDILVSTVRPNLRGFARLRQAPSNLVVSTGFAVVTPNQSVADLFLYHHIMSSRFARFLQDATTGQAYPAVRPDDVGTYRLPLPPLEEQQSIASLLDSIDQTLERNTAKRNTLKTSKESIAAALLTGLVQASQAANR